MLTKSKICSCFGSGMLSSELKERVGIYADRVIDDGVRVFLFDCMGDLAGLMSEIAAAKRRKYPDIGITLMCCLSFGLGDVDMRTGCDIRPSEQRKADILRKICAMIDMSDYIFLYADGSNDILSYACRYASEKEKRVINFASKPL